jgi:hypothetical protein
MATLSDAERTADALKSQIQRAFPDTTFSGSVTPADGASDAELDEERSLYAALRGRKWSEVSEQFVRNNPDGFVLLTDQAFPAFLAAWLMGALVNSSVREMVVYSFTPKDPRGGTEGRLRMLSDAQKSALRGFLSYCAAVEASESIKERVKSAIAHLARL